jgi:hypothetical protein
MIQIMDERSDLDELRDEFPAWGFGSVWASAATRADWRRLTASRYGILLTAWNAAELAGKIRWEEDASAFDRTSYT